MGMMDKFLNAMRLNADDEEYLDDDYYDEDEDFYEDEFTERRKGSFFKRNNNTQKMAANDDSAVQPERSTTRFTNSKRASTGNNGRRSEDEATSAKITPMRQHKRETGGHAVMEVCVIKPKSVDDAREITETLLEGRTIVLNLEGIDLDVGQRIIDFTSGSCFAIGGNLQKVTNYIFIATPKGVDISGDFQSIVDAFDVSSIHMDI